MINVCIKQNADSNSSLQQQQQQILYLLRHNSVQEFIAWYYTIAWSEGVNNRVHVYTITSDSSLKQLISIKKQWISPRGFYFLLDTWFVFEKNADKIGLYRFKKGKLLRLIP